MNWISNFFSRYWRNVHFVTIALAAMVFIYGEPAVNGFASRVAISAFHYPFFKIKSTFVDLAGVHQENERLREALVDASVKLSNLEEDRLESSRLRTALSFEPPVAYTMLPAKVVSLSGSPLPVTAIINRGAADSVLVNQPVINEDGLIGRVISVTDEFSVIQLLTDPANRVASRIQRSRDMGISRYRIGRGLVLDNFAVQGDILPGDTVISSGLGGIYPSGLRVGTVGDVERPAEAPFCRVTINPSASFSRLDELFILRAETR